MASEFSFPDFPFNVSNKFPNKSMIRDRRKKFFSLGPLLKDSRQIDNYLSKQHVLFRKGIWGILVSSVEAFSNYIVETSLYKADSFKSSVMNLLFFPFIFLTILLHFLLFNLYSPLLTIFETFGSNSVLILSSGMILYFQVPFIAFLSYAFILVLMVFNKWVWLPNNSKSKVYLAGIFEKFFGNNFVLFIGDHIPFGFCHFLWRREFKTKNLIVFNRDPDENENYLKERYNKDVRRWLGPDKHSKTNCKKDYKRLIKESAAMTDFSIKVEFESEGNKQNVIINGNYEMDGVATVSFFWGNRTRRVKKFMQYLSFYKLMEFFKRVDKLKGDFAVVESESEDLEFLHSLNVEEVVEMASKFKPIFLKSKTKRNILGKTLTLDYLDTKMIKSLKPILQKNFSRVISHNIDFFGELNSFILVSLLDKRRNFMMHKKLNLGNTKIKRYRAELSMFLANSGIKPLNFIEEKFIRNPSQAYKDNYKSDIEIKFFEDDSKNDFIPDLYITGADELFKDFSSCEDLVKKSTSSSDILDDADKFFNLPIEKIKEVLVSEIEDTTKNQEKNATVASSSSNISGDPSDQRDEVNEIDEASMSESEIKLLKKAKKEEQRKKEKIEKAARLKKAKIKEEKELLKKKDHINGIMIKKLFNDCNLFSIKGEENLKENLNKENFKKLDISKSFDSDLICAGINLREIRNFGGDKKTILETQLEGLTQTYKRIFIEPIIEENEKNANMVVKPKLNEEKLHKLKKELFHLRTKKPDFEHFNKVKGQAVEINSKIQNKISNKGETFIKFSVRNKVKSEKGGQRKKHNKDKNGEILRVDKNGILGLIADSQSLHNKHLSVNKPIKLLKDRCLKDLNIRRCHLKNFFRKRSRNNNKESFFKKIIMRGNNETCFPVIKKNFPSYLKKMNELCLEYMNLKELFCEKYREKGKLLMTNEEMKTESSIKESENLNKIETNLRRWSLLLNLIRLHILIKLGID